MRKPDEILRNGLYLSKGGREDSFGSSRERAGVYKRVGRGPSGRRVRGKGGRDYGSMGLKDSNLLLGTFEGGRNGEKVS